MSSQTRETRGDANGLDLRTLAIASVAAAVAAVVVSRIWTAGTPIAAAATPVIVTLLKELLDRPTAKIADRMTAESPALGQAPARAAEQVTPPDEHRPGDVRVYRQPAGKRRIKPKVVAVTAVIAFVIAGVLVTGGQVLAGNPFGSNGTGALFLGQDHTQKTTTVQTTTQTVPQRQQTTTVTTPASPAQTTTTPSSGRTVAPTQQQRSQSQQSTTTTPTTTSATPGK